MGSFKLSLVTMRGLFVCCILFSIYLCSISAEPVRQDLEATPTPDPEICQKLKHRVKGGHHISPRQQALLDNCDDGPRTDRESVIKRCKKLVAKNVDDLGRYQRTKFQACMEFLEEERKAILAKREGHGGDM